MRFAATCIARRLRIHYRGLAFVRHSWRGRFLRLFAQIEAKARFGGEVDDLLSRQIRNLRRSKLRLQDPLRIANEFTQ